jgi:hypothetical protein
MSFGKHFGSMYSGSMVGAGAMVFAVWGYVIANMRPESRDLEAAQIVELNPKLLGPILGESPKDVEKAIERLCAPDPESRTKEMEGRRLEDLGAFLYRVINGAFYRSIKNEEQRKEQLRLAQAKWRERNQPKKKKAKPYPGERLAQMAAEDGRDTGEVADRVNQERGFEGE